MSKYGMKETILGNHEGMLTTMCDKDGYTTYLEVSINDNINSCNKDLDKCLDSTIGYLDKEIEKLMHVRSALVDMRNDIDDEDDEDMTKFFDESECSEDESLEGKKIQSFNQKKVIIDKNHINSDVPLGIKRVEYVEDILAPYGFKLKPPYINSEYATFENDKEDQQVIIGTTKERDKLEIWVAGLQAINIPEYDFSQLKPLYSVFRKKFVNW